MEQGSDTKQLAVSEPNALGIASLEIRHFQQGDDHMFELVALTKSGVEVAHLQERLGLVTGITAGVTDETGAEISIAVGDKTMTALTYEVVRPTVHEEVAPPDIAPFLHLATVRSTLETEAGIHIIPKPDETTYLTITNATCSTSQLLTAPVAGQCCTETFSGNDNAHRPITLLSTSGWTATGYEANGAQVPDYDDWGNAEWGGLAIDGSTSTRFSTNAAQSSGMYLLVDMGATKTIDHVVIDSGTSTTDYAHEVQMYTSNDGTNWTLFGPDTTPAASPITINSAAQTGRYLKIVQLGTSTSWWSIAELKVYGWNDDDLDRSSWTATGYEADGSQVPNYDAWSNAQWGGLAIDGSTTTRFSTGTAQVAGQSLKIDMGACMVVDRVVMDSGASSGDYARGWEMYTSTNGTSWGSYFAHGTGTGAVITTPSAYTGSIAQGRYLKIVQTGSSGSWWSIHDLHVYGYPCTGLTQNSGLEMHFFRAATAPGGQALIVRDRNPTGNTCKGWGDDACTGAACFYGPQGFGVATVYPYTIPSGWYTKIGGPAENDVYCSQEWFQSPPTPYWTDVTGTSTPGQGCPGGSTGAYRWDY